MKGFRRFLTFERRINPDALDDAGVTMLVQSAYAAEFARLRPEDAEKKLARIGPDNYLFTELPPEEWTAAEFKHRGIYYGPRWREIFVEKRRNQVQKIFTVSHDALHALSADETGSGGIRKYMHTLAEWGYSGLDEAVTDHFARHVIQTQILPKMHPRVTHAFLERNAYHSYSYLVTFLERLLKAMGDTTRQSQETAEAAYERVRDDMYKKYLAGNVDAVLGMLHSYIAPGAGTVFAAVLSPRGGEASQNEAEGRLRAAEEVSRSFSTSVEFDGTRTAKTLYRPYLDRRNYPGYPDGVRDAFVAEAVRDHYIHTLTDVHGMNILTDPLTFVFDGRSYADVLHVIARIDEDRELVKRNGLHGLEREFSTINRLHTILMMIADLASPDHVTRWRAMVEAATTFSDNPNIHEIRRRGRKAYQSSKESMQTWTADVYDYISRRISGDASARILLK